MFKVMTMLGNLRILKVRQFDVRILLDERGFWVVCRGLGGFADEL